MTEPEYFYVRGQGWVVSTFETIVLKRSIRSKKYKVTVLRRPPKLDEHGWYFPKFTFPNIQDEEIDYYNGGFGWIANEKEPNYPNEILCTIETELIK